MFAEDFYAVYIVWAFLICAIIALGFTAARWLQQKDDLKKQMDLLGEEKEELENTIISVRQDCEEKINEWFGLANNLPPIWMRNSDLQMIYCNTSFSALLETNPQDVINKGWELIDGRDSERARMMARKALESGTTQSGRFHVVFSGRRRYVEVHEAPLGDGRLVGYGRDITETEDISISLERTMGAHKAVLNSINVPIGIYDASLHIEFFNPAFADIFHLDENFLEKRPHFSEILDAKREARRIPEQADFADFKRNMVRHVETLVEPYEDLMHLPDGTTIHHVFSPHPFGGLVHVAEDVTSHLHLESTYNTLLDVQRATLNNLFEGIAVYGSDGRLKLFNPAFAIMWDLSISFLNGNPHVRDILEQAKKLHDVPKEQWKNYVEQKVALATEPHRRSGVRERPDGLVLKWSQTPLPDGSSLYTFLDITDTKQVEKALRERNEALEMADRLKSEFIANVSYELRTPLNAIIGFGEILENKYFGNLNDRQMDYAQAIVSSSRRLMNLVNNILDLASIEAGYLKLDYQSVDIRQMLENTVSLIQERARENDVQLVLDCPRDIGEMLCDERRLVQAVFNLLSNAIKYSPKSSGITLSSHIDGEDVVVSVNDAGVGIPPEDQDRIFHKFERGSQKQFTHGAGLGLALVKSLIELHGGRISLLSGEDVGTTVVCHIPKNRYVENTNDNPSQDKIPREQEDMKDTPN